MMFGETISGYGTIAPTINDPTLGSVTVADYGSNIVLYQDFPDPNTGQPSAEPVEIVAKFSARFWQLMKAASPMETPAALQRYLDPAEAFRETGTVPPEAYLHPALTDGPAVHTEPAPELAPITGYVRTQTPPEIVSGSVIDAPILYTPPIDPGMSVPGSTSETPAAAPGWLKPGLVLAGVYLLGKWLL